MALERLNDDEVYRWYLASPLAFADWTQPTSAELNANPTNDPNGLIWNITCAVNVDGSQFDLDDPDADESLTFCQSQGNSEATEYSATIVHSIAMSKERWLDASSLVELDPNTGQPEFNTSTLAQSLLMWRGIEYFAILSIGENPDEPFAPGNRIKMAEIATDWGIPEGSSGDNYSLVATHAKRSRLLWNYSLAS